LRDHLTRYVADASFARAAKSPFGPILVDEPCFGLELAREAGGQPLFRTAAICGP
jgi:hypothetical protein